MLEKAHNQPADLARASASSFDPQVAYLRRARGDGDVLFRNIYYIVRMISATSVMLHKFII